MCLYISQPFSNEPLETYIELICRVHAGKFDLESLLLENIGNKNDALRS